MKIVPCNVFNPDVRFRGGFRLVRERNRIRLIKNPAFRKAKMSAFFGRADSGGVPGRHAPR